MKQLKTAAILLFAIGVVCVGQSQAPEMKRLESVTWDLKEHKLMWVVQKGTMTNGHFGGSSVDRYEISPNEAVMAFADQRRGFSPQEAAGVQKLLDTLSLYCAESVIWWDHGE